MRAALSSRGIRHTATTASPPSTPAASPTRAAGSNSDVPGLRMSAAPPKPIRAALRAHLTPRSFDATVAASDPGPD